MDRTMKDTGVEWIGEIPVEWEVRKLSAIAKTITDYVASGSFASLSENVKYLDEPDFAMLIRTVDLSNKTSKQPIYIDERAYKFLSNSNLFGGEIILSNIGSVGNVFMYEPMYERASLAPNSIMIRMLENNRYYYYWFLNPIVNETLKIIGSDSVQAKFNKTQLRQFLVAHPPESEQKKIAAFLDDKTAQIDSIIDNTKQSIAEFKKYKQALITETVTNGLNPDVKMKDSGIEWIGEIPEHWDVNTAKRVFQKEKRPIVNDEIVTAFRDGEVTQRRNRRTDGFTMADKEIGYQGVKPGDLVIHAMDAFAGAIGVSDSPGKCSPVCSICTPIIEANSYYYAYLLRTYSVLGYIESMAKGIRERSTDFRYATFAITPLVQPPINEQQQIVDFLDEKIAHINALIADKEKMVQELEEYKKALIYEYVTGKKEV